MKKSNKSSSKSSESETTKPASVSERQGRVNRGLKPRSASSYSNEEYGRADSRLPQDTHTLNDKCCRVGLVRARYTEPGPLVFRPWPALDLENPSGNLQRGRISANERGQGNWIVRVPVAKYIGTADGENSTFILYQPGDKEGRANNPYIHFYRATKAAYDAGEFGTGRAWDSKWNRLFKGAKGAAISKPNALWYVQGEVYMSGEKNFYEDREGVPYGGSKDDELVLIEIAGSAGDNLVNLLDLRKESFEGDPDENPAAPFVYGDPCGRYDVAKEKLIGGLFFSVFNPAKNSKRFISHPNTTWDGKIKDVQGYEVAIDKKITINNEEISPSMGPAATANIFNRAQFWFPDPDATTPSENDGLLKILPFDEQCLLIAKAFSDVPKLFRFAFEDKPEAFTEDVEAVLRQRATVSMPDMSDDDSDDDDADDDIPASTKKKKDVTAPKGASGKGKKVVDEFEDEFEDEDENEDEVAADTDDTDDDDADDEGDEAEAEEADDEFADDDEEEAAVVDEESDDDTDDEVADDEEAADEEADEFADDDEDDQDDDAAPAEEDNSVSDEFELETEIDTTEKKMRQALDKAAGRSSKRESKAATKPTTKAAPKASVPTKAAAKKSSKPAAKSGDKPGKPATTKRR